MMVSVFALAALMFQGYRHRNAFIVTQWPLSSTVKDIWRLVYDYNIPTMVLLNEHTASRVSQLSVLTTLHAQPHPPRP